MPRAIELNSAEPIAAPSHSQPSNNATRIIVATMGVLLALGGIDHGLFETLQGNTPTSGLFIHSIGPHQQMWQYGTEDALTLIPNYLASGLISIALSLAIAVWSIGFVHRRHGSAIFLSLSVALFLSGGGVAQVVFFSLAWAVSLAIPKPPQWPRELALRLNLSRFDRVWPVCLAAFVLLSLAGLEIAIAGYVPGVHDALRAQNVCWSLLGFALSALLVGILSGFARDAAG